MLKAIVPFESPNHHTGTWTTGKNKQIDDILIVKDVCFF